MASNQQQTRTRSQRVASVELPPGRFSSLIERMRSGAAMLRLAMALVLTMLMLVMTRGWSPPRDYYLKKIPTRDIVAAVEFKQFDERATVEKKEQARRYAEAVYDNDPIPLAQLKSQVKNEVSQLVASETYEAVDQSLWQLYLPERAENTPKPTNEELSAQFMRFKESLAGEEEQRDFDRDLDTVFEPLERQGILETQPTDANLERIQVQLAGNQGFETVVAVRDALLDNVQGDMKASLISNLGNLGVAQHVFARVQSELPVTLKLNPEATREQQEELAAEVEKVFRTYERGELLAKAGEPIGESELELLELGYNQRLKNRTVADKFIRGVSVLWCYLGLITLCGVGLMRSDPQILEELQRYTVLLTLCALALAGILLTHGQSWRTELVPLLLLAMTLAIAYRHTTAMLIAGSVTLISAMALRLSLADTMVLVAPMACSVAMLDSVRHRSKLLLVGFASGLIAIGTTLALGLVEGKPFLLILQISLVIGLWPVVAASLMTLCLPIVEKLFHVQTDLSLIELGDPAHPLLQELVRRAPGTYNHSITVASIAEAAAVSIGARGLLVRVGAYFHDIGKMLKPGYFIENQGLNGNQHDSLVPAMSTLVIIAHVKDGADLARQNKLPECIIDFILQHHGTTLVEYFYRQAQQKKNEDGEEVDVDETSFRYPGPKPQSREAGVLMLADAVESASRALVEPTPSRIESLVEDIMRKRLEDGQFDESGLTLQEVRTIGDSLVKSLTAVYHGRVKYPGQETA